jgi:hypothetical protein
MIIYIIFKHRLNPSQHGLGKHSSTLTNLVTFKSWSSGLWRRVLMWLDIRVNIQAARSSKMSVSYHLTTRRHNPEDRDLNLHHRENLASGNLLTYLNPTVPTVSTQGGQSLFTFTSVRPLLYFLTIFLFVRLLILELPVVMSIDKD